MTTTQKAETLQFPSHNATGPEGLEKLCALHSQAKDAVKTATDRVAEIEARIIEIVGVENEGAFSVTVADKFKVTTTGKVNRSIDDAAIKRDWPALPPQVQDAFTFKAALNMKQIRALELANPDAYKAAAKYITAKPGKPTVTIKPLES